jgi:hypothetical protein
MKTMLRNVTLKEEDNLVESLSIPIVLPDSPLEIDFLSSWIIYDLREDLGDIGSDWALLESFHKAVNRIVYAGNGVFAFDPADKKSGFGPTDITFLIHLHFDPDLLDAGIERRDFELMWSRFGVTQSLYEDSVVDELIKLVK